MLLRPVSVVLPFLLVSTSFELLERSIRLQLLQCSDIVSPVQTIMYLFYSNTSKNEIVIVSFP